MFSTKKVILRDDRPVFTIKGQFVLLLCSSFNFSKFVKMFVQQINELLFALT